MKAVKTKKPTRSSKVEITVMVPQYVIDYYKKLEKQTDVPYTDIMVVFLTHEVNQLK